MSVEFSPQRDVTPPTNRVNGDEARSNGGRETVSYHGVPIAITTEYLKEKHKRTHVFLNVKCL